MNFDTRIVNAIHYGTQLANNKNQVYKSKKHTWKQASVAIILKSENKISIPIEKQLLICNKEILHQITSQKDFCCQMLVCQRARNEKDLHSGQICFPGGKLEQNENDIDGAVRETYEEIGLNLRELQCLYLGRLPNNFKIEDISRKMHLCAHVFLILEENVELKLNKSEISEYKWIPLHYFINLQGKIRTLKLPNIFAFFMISEIFNRSPVLCKIIYKQFQYGYISVVDLGMELPLMGYTHFIIAQLFQMVLMVDKNIIREYPNLSEIVDALQLYYLKFNDQNIVGNNILLLFMHFVQFIIFETLQQVTGLRKEQYQKIYAQFMNSYLLQYISYLLQMDIEYCEEVPEEVITSIANVLDDLLMETEELEDNKKSGFHSQKKPSISLANYLRRIQKYSYCSNNCYILALIYIDRVQDKHKDFVVNGFCIHRILLIAIIISIKYIDDDYYKNEYYAKVGGVPLQELNQLEAELLNLLNFQLYVEPNLYFYYKDKLSRYSKM